MMIMMNKTIQEQIISFCKNEESKQHIKNFIRPFTEMIYNEVYLYLWLLSIYCIFLFVSTLAILILLLRQQNSAIIHVHS